MGKSVKHRGVRILNRRRSPGCVQHISILCVPYIHPVCACLSSKLGKHNIKHGILFSISISSKSNFIRFVIYSSRKWRWRRRQRFGASSSPLGLSTDCAKLCLGISRAQTLLGMNSFCVSATEFGHRPPILCHFFQYGALQPKHCRPFD